MSRPLRILYPGAWYHVMNRGLERRQIFLDRLDCEEFFRLLQEISQLWQVEIHAFSLMPNHYHLLLRTHLPNLPRCMRHLNGVYTQRFNRKHGRDGPLLRGRYKAILVEEESYLIELVRYIHLNPVIAKLAHSLNEHLWTSHRYYCRPKQRPSWLHTDFILKYFGEEGKKTIRSFQVFVGEGVPDELKKKLSGRRWPSILGTATYKDWVIDNFLKDRGKTTVMPDMGREKRRYKLQDILKSVSDICDCPITHLRKSWRAKGNEGRRLAIYLVWEYMGMTQERVAKVFKGITAAGVAQSNQRLQGNLKEDKFLQEKIQAVRRRIEQSVLNV